MKFLIKILFLFFCPLLHSSRAPWRWSLDKRRLNPGKVRGGRLNPCVCLISCYSLMHYRLYYLILFIHFAI